MWPCVREPRPPLFFRAQTGPWHAAHAVSDGACRLGAPGDLNLAADAREGRPEVRRSLSFALFESSW
eukprot:87030-Alexandrium_andersonii.AAC.1